MFFSKKKFTRNGIQHINLVYLFLPMSKMLKFVDVQRETPEKLSSDVRKDNFLEIYKEFIETKAKEQASRCSQCGTPFCQVHCPLQNNIPDWLKLTAEGRLKDAYEVSSATNSMPEV